MGAVSRVGTLHGPSPLNGSVRVSRRGTRSSWLGTESLRLVLRLSVGRVRRPQVRPQSPRRARVAPGIGRTDQPS